MVTTKQKIIVGVLLLTLLLASGIVYVSMGDTVRIRVDEDKTTFYVKLLDNDGNPKGRWLVSGREYNKFFNGTRLIYRHAKDVNVTIDINNKTNKVKITRITPYYNDADIVDTYLFDGSIDDVNLFPISHTVEIFNGNKCGKNGCIYQWEVRDLDYDGITRIATSPESFGKRMKASWMDGAYYQKIFQQLFSDKLIVKYRVKSDYMKIDLRFFDPVNESKKINKTPEINETPVIKPLINDIPIIPPQNETTPPTVPPGGGSGGAEAKNKDDTLPDIQPPTGKDVLVFKSGNTWVALEPLDCVDKKELVHEIILLNESSDLKIVPKNIDITSKSMKFGFKFSESKLCVDYKVTSNRNLFLEGNDLKYLISADSFIFDKNPIMRYNWKDVKLSQFLDKSLNENATLNYTGKVNKTTGAIYYIARLDNALDHDPEITESFTSELGGTYNDMEWDSTDNHLQQSREDKICLKFDTNKTIANTTLDSCSYNHNLVVDNATWLSNSGIRGSGTYSFNGIDNVLYKSNIGLNSTGSKTMMGWFKVNAIMGTPQVIVSWGRGFSQEGFHMQTDGAYETGCSSWDGVGSMSSTFIEGTWYHLTCVYNGTHIIQYYNGNLTGSRAKVINSGIYNYLSLGAKKDLSSTSNPFNGTIDDFSITPRVLSASEISSRYNGTNNRSDYIPAYKTPGNFTRDATRIGFMTTLNNITINGSYGNSTSVNRDTSDSNLVYWFTHDSDSLALKGAQNGTDTAVTYTGKGINGSGYYDKISSTTLIPNNDALNMDTYKNFSTCIWGYPQSTTTQEGVIDAGNLVPRWEMDFLSGTLFTIHANTGAGALTFSDNQDLSGGWHHLCSTWNRTENVTMYVDGVNRGTRALTNIGNLTSVQDIYIGSNGGANLYYEGHIDETKFWNTTLTPLQILEEYHKRPVLLEVQLRTLNTSNVWSSWYNNALVTLSTGLIVVNTSLPQGRNYQYKTLCSSGDEEFTCELSRLIFNFDDNQIPTHTQPILNSSDGSNHTEQNLSVFIQGVSDGNNDSLYNITSWTKKGNKIMLLNLPFEGVNGTESTNVTDYSGLKSHGNVSGFTWNQTGGFDGRGAYTNDGSAGNITLPGTNLQFSRDKDFSFGFKYRTPNIATAQRLISTYSATPRGGWGTILSASKFIWHTRQGTGDDLVAKYDVALLSNKWYDIFVNANRSSGNISIFINGISVPVTVSGNVTGLANNLNFSGVLSIGERQDEGANYLSGTIDDVVFYNQTLSGAQVLALYQNRTDLFLSQETNRTEQWQACITPNDGYNDGAENCSNTLNVTNCNCPVSPKNWNLYMDEICLTNSICNNTGYNITLQSTGNWTINASVYINKLLGQASGMTIFGLSSTLFGGRS